MPKRDALIIGTRASTLAMWQAEHVQSRLATAGVEAMLEQVRTTGDRILDVPLAEIGDKGLFTKELDVALLEGRIHTAVHSLKDLPTVLPEGIVLAAVSAREEPWDAFVAHPSFDGGLEDLPDGARLATSSLRRQAQLKAWRPDLRIESIRGNVETRLAKLDGSELHGTILAVAGLVRLRLQDRIRQRIPTDLMLPAVSQGALGIVCAENDVDSRRLLRNVLHDTRTGAAVTAERAFLRRLEGGCSVPIGAWARIEGDQLLLDGCVASLDGSRLLRDRLAGSRDDAADTGTRLAEMLIREGADEILDDIRRAEKGE